TPRLSRQLRSALRRTPSNRPEAGDGCGIDLRDEVRAARRARRTSPGRCVYLRSARTCGDPTTCVRYRGPVPPRSGCRRISSVGVEPAGESARAAACDDRTDGRTALDLDLVKSSLWEERPSYEDKHAGGWPQPSGVPTGVAVFAEDTSIRRYA